MKLVQIVPRLPPAIDGLGDYAVTLARGLAQSGVSSCFLVAAPSWPPSEELAGAPIGERTARNLVRQLAASGAEAVLVQYVNYGYQRRGYPSWLVTGVARWRAAASSRRLVTFFHEVSASGPPWRSSFWLAPAQRRLAARLLHTSDGAATSLRLYERILARWRPRREVVVQPIFSSVGEPAMVPRPADRRPRAMVVFGGRGNRRRAYSRLRSALGAACSALDIAEILDLGPVIDALPAQVAGVPVRALGPRPHEEVSAILLRSYAGFLAYPAPFLPKSTVFAAYCAHGLVPVCAWTRRSPRGGAEERPPCWQPTTEPAPPDPDALAAQARAWYGRHDVAHHAAALRSLLFDGGPAEPRQR
jgi:hypothetical protein